MCRPSNTGIYLYIRNRYEDKVMKQGRRYMNTLNKIARQYQHITFNNKCRRYEVIPRSLRVKPLVDTDEGQQIASRASSRFLSAWSGERYTMLKKQKQELA